eukprot:scaffold47188_cov22-Tisochrysis_lutea.AAC.2
MQGHQSIPVLVNTIADHYTAALVGSCDGVQVAAQPEEAVELYLAADRPRQALAILNQQLSAVLPHAAEEVATGLDATGGCASKAGMHKGTALLCVSCVQTSVVGRFCSVVSAMYTSASIHNPLNGPVMQRGHGMVVSMG